MNARLREQFLRGLVGVVAFSCGCVEPGHVEQRWEAMGETAYAEVYTTTAGDAEPVVAAVREAIASVAASVRSDAGGLGRINAEAASGYYRFSDAEHDLYRTVLLALDYARASHGAFDPTVGPLMRLYRGDAPVPRAPREEQIRAVLPLVGWQNVIVASEARAIHFRHPKMELDLGGIAKGLALDSAARAFSRPGVQAGLLQVGGNLYAWGEPPGGAAWNVGVPDPRFSDRMLLRIRTTNRGIAVSGQTDPRESGRWRPPVLDPSTGRPASGNLLAAVAVADSGADADAMSTALFAAGFHRAAELLGRTRRVEAVLLVEGDAAPYVLASASLEGHLELAPALEAEAEGRIRYLLPPQSIDLPF